MCINTAGNDGGDFDQRTALLERLHQRPAVDVSDETAAPAPPPRRWTLQTIRNSIPWLHGYTVSGVWRVLQRCKLKLRSARLRLYSPDPDYASKESEVLCCLHAAAQAPADIVVLFLDEMGYYRWPTAAPDWGSAALLPPPEGRSSGTNTQWRIVGALNAVTGQVDYMDEYMVGRRQLITFYKRLVERYADVARIYVVQDNWSIHRHSDVLTALQQWPQLVPVWLPIYAPWLKPIEKLWRWLRQDVLHLHRLAHDWVTLRQQVRWFLDQFAHGSSYVLRYVGLLGAGRLAQAMHCACLPIMLVKLD